ncbi:winged helix-turn-helix domain-containing protein [Dactylosporangium roseum]|uniref:Winged helix-turn-helix domain-containing protein n=1 Tax=Dactylosporangium roseum TaxID=47989 RepID=A0ABY5ZA86_9ACTN|nr:BTAD domain-containing putative transcriptional regulator [Dactylosporangium roseum]UWZ38777.1 winged helix-turn-helix domain-containing protein [Dactylosporangium roseum]
MDVRVLGRLEIIGQAAGGERRLTGDDLPRRARQVLGVLAARHDRLQSKDALADAVWGEELPGNHVAALEHYVSVLRRTLQPGVPTARSFIVTRAGGYVFATDRARLDLAELRTAARLAETRPDRADVREQIVRLARDLPFAEDEYAEWAAPARAEVRAVVVAALLDLSEAAAGADPARAQRLAREASELEPFTERAYRAGMRAAGGLGRADAVIQWYDRCRRTLDQELGVAPSRETVTLRDTLLTAFDAGVERPGPPAHDRRRGDRRRPVLPDVARQPVTGFLGRDAELAALAGGPAVVHVAGPAGAGKSALLARLRELHPGTAGLGRGPGPGGALRLGWLRTVLHQLGRPADDVLDAAMAERRALHPAELDSIAHGLPGRIVAIDDAEHLDADSVVELRWLQEHGLRVVVSYRYPSAIAARPLGALDAGLVLRLEPLTGADLDPATLAASGGIPALVAADPATAGQVAMHLARQRTRWMAPAAWVVLRLTAALGTLRVEQLAAVAGLGVDEILDAVDGLVHAHLLVEGRGGRVRHRSGLIRDAVAAQVSAARSHHLRTRLTAG